jgi:hypothetical protein
MASTDEPKLQADKFRDLARELGTDDDEKAFEEKVRRLALKPAEGPKNDKSG